MHNCFYSAVQSHCPTCHCSLDGDSEKMTRPLPPPLPPPSYSVHRRVLPSSLLALSSDQGRQRLVEHLTCPESNTESYYRLTQHAMNQSDPAYCGVTTLVVVLNALSIDPNVRWKGGWRYFGDEGVLLSRCCLSAERIQRVGISMEEFYQLATCQGVNVKMTRWSNDSATGLDNFRLAVQATFSSSSTSAQFLVVSFSRASLGQTGDGHFSPLAAYHAPTDSVLVWDVARFKYPPYWAPLTQLYHAMQPEDEITNQPRGWYVMSSSLSLSKEDFEKGEDRRPAKLVPLANEPDICPLGKVKVQYCKASHYKVTE